MRKGDLKQAWSDAGTGARKTGHASGEGARPVDRQPRALDRGHVARVLDRVLDAGPCPPPDPRENQDRNRHRLDALLGCAEEDPASERRTR